MEKEIKIVLCTDTYYMMACGPCIVSIFEHQCKIPYHVYVVTKKLPASDVEGLRQISDKYGCKLTVKNVNPEILSNLKVNDRFRESVYYRFLLPDLFPEADKMIYMDCDTLLNRPLQPLWDTDIKDYACGVVEDQESDDIALQNRIGVYDQPYFNSGVLLINLNYWRQHNITQRLVNFVQENPDKGFFPDQDALNAVLKSQVKYLPFGYNYQNLWYSAERQWLRLHASKFEELDRWKSNPVVVHFTGDNKPWKKYCNNPFTQYYLDCLAKTPWTIKCYTPPREEFSPTGETRKRTHKYIRRFNRLLIVFILETIALLYLLCT